MNTTSQEIRHVSMGANNCILRAADHVHAPQLIAKHVMNIHMNRPNTGGGTDDGEGEINLDKMKRYIAYCKSYVEVETCTLMWSVHLQRVPCDRKCAPRLSPEAQETLSSHFVALRKQVQQVEQDNDERSSIPITVRYVAFDFNWWADP